jgi:histidinol dehydrogenase
MTPLIKHCGNCYINTPSPLGDYMVVGKGCLDPTYGMAKGIPGSTIGSFYTGSCFSTGLSKPDAPIARAKRLAELEQFPYHAAAIQAYSK